MRYTSEADYLKSHTTVPEGDLPIVLDAAERDIDGLTYNRITARGFDTLSQFQQDLIREAVYQQAEFRYQFGEMVASPFSSYGINGVSMSFDLTKMIQRSGVYAPVSVVAMLMQTGLMLREVSS